MVVRGEAIGERVKYWVRPNIINRIKEGSITAYFNSEIKTINEEEVLITTPEGVQSIPNDFVLALTGYQPNFDFIKNANIAFTQDERHLPIYNEHTMETNIDGLYLAGVICGGKETHKWFIENSRIHAVRIANHIDQNS